MIYQKQFLIASLAVLVLLLTGCAAASAADAVLEQPEPAAARVFFTAPQDGATVSSPVQVVMAAENFVIEPAGEINAGAGHLHIMVNTSCIAPGQGIPNDERHLHYGQAQLEAELELEPGEYTLCLQAADGAHVALSGEGMTHEITVTVE
jgi:hypothetical protein